jgi:hypothetical protein
MNIKAFINFISQHYERLIAVVVMLVLVVFSILLLLNVNDLKNQIQQDTRPKKALVNPVDLNDLEVALQTLQNPPVWAESKEDKHRLFVGPMLKELHPGSGTLDHYIQSEVGTFKTDEGFEFEWLHKYGLPTNRHIADSDPDGDEYTVREEYDAGTNPVDPKSRPDAALKLRVKEIVKRSFPFVFNGVFATSDEKDPNFSLQRIDTKEQYFVKLHGMIKDKDYPDYKIILYKPIFLDEEDLSIKGPDGKPTIFKRDKSELTLENEQTKETIILVKGQSRTTEEFYAKLFYMIKNETLNPMSKGTSFTLEGNEYQILEVVNTPKEDDIRVKIQRVDKNIPFSLRPLSAEEKSASESKEGVSRGAEDQEKEK